MATYTPITSLLTTPKATTPSSISSINNLLGVQVKQPTVASPTYTAPTSQIKVPTTNNGSVVDYLTSQGKASDYNSRTGLAQQYGIQGYSGTAEQNTQLLNYLKNPTTSTAPTTPKATTPTIYTPSVTPTPTAPTNPKATTPTTPTIYTPSVTPTPTAPTPVTSESVAPTYQPNTDLQGQIISGLANMSTASSPQYLQQLAETNRINQQMEEAKKRFAQQTSDINQSGTWTSRALGEQGQANIQNASVLSALGSQYQGATNQLGAANTQQGLLQQALQQAGNLNQPVYGVGYGTQVGQPALTGGGLTGSGDMNTAMATYAQNMASGQMSAIPTSITGNPVLMAQLQERAKQINPNFNYNVATGLGSAQIDSTASQANQVQTWTSALQQGKNLQAQMTDLISQFGINPSNINKVNAGLQVIANNVSDPRYKIFSNYLNDIANTYAQILTPTGVSQTDKTRELAGSMLDATMSGKGLVTVMQSLDQAVQAKLTGVPTAGGMGTQQSSVVGLHSW